MVLLSYFFYVFRLPAFLGGIVIGMPNAPISVLAWAAGGYQGLISGLWFRSHCRIDVASAERFKVAFHHNF